MSETELTTAETLSIDWLHDFMQWWGDAWNSHDVDGVLALMTEDIEYRDDSWPKPMRGHTDVREFLEAVWRAMPDMTLELLSGPYLINGEPCAAFHWRGCATLTGPLEPLGFAPTGRRWELDGGDFYEFRGGRVCKVRTVYDVLSVSRQLGLLPPAGGRAERAAATAQRFTSRAQQAMRKLPRGRPNP